MSGLGNALPKAEWMAWLQSVFDPHKQATEHHVEVAEATFKQHDGRLSDLEAAVVALDKAQEEQDGHLDELDARLRVLEGKEVPQEPEEPPEPGEPPEEPTEPQEPPGEPQEPVRVPVIPPRVTLAGVGSHSDSLRVYPPTPYVTDGHEVRTVEQLLAAVEAGRPRVLLRGGQYRLPRALDLTTPNQLVAAYGNERVMLDRSQGATEGEAAYALRVLAAGAHVLGLEVTGVPERKDATYSSHAVRVQADGARLERLNVHDGMTGSIIVYEADDVLVLDCDTWGCSGAGSGTNRPDGIVGTARSGRTIRNLRVIRPFVANASDDGIDLYRVVNGLVLDFVTVGNGYSPTGASLGDGSGVKCGGGAGAGGNTIWGGLALGNKLAGINHNSSHGAPNLYAFNTAARNARGVIADTGTLPTTKGNLAWGNPTYDQTVQGEQARNSWNERTGDPRFANPTIFDYSLLPGSPAIGAGPDGQTLGASSVALAIAVDRLARYRVFLPRA